MYIILRSVLGGLWGLLIAIAYETMVIKIMSLILGCVAIAFILLEIQDHYERRLR